MTRVPVLPLLAIAGVAAATYVVATSGTNLLPAAPLTAPAQTPFLRTVAGAGIVEPSTRPIAVGTPIAGVVAEVLVTVGDRVQAVFLIAGRLFAAIEIHVEPGETDLLAVPVGELMKRFGMILVSLQLARPDTNSHTLSSGDRLTVIASLADLDRFYRRGA